MDSQVVVVGGGPVGATVGLLLPDALVLDAAGFPRDKVCGEGLMPAGAAILRGAGLDLQQAGFPRLAGVCYRLPGGESARADFAQGTGFGTRRMRLDAILAERARVRTQVRVTSVRVAPDRVELETTQGPLSCAALVIADGLGSPVGRMAGIRSCPHGKGRYAIVGHLGAAAPGTDVEVSLLGDVDTYLAPVGPNELLFAVLARRGRLRGRGLSTEESYRAALARAHPRLADAPSLGRLRGAGPFGIRPTTVARGRIFLAGDAAGFLDPLTGDGMTAGLQQAELLASLLRGDLTVAGTRYRQFWRGQWRRRLLLSALASRLTRASSLNQRALKGLARRPLALQRLLSINEGQASLSVLSPLDWAALLGWAAR